MMISRTIATLVAGATMLAAGSAVAADLANDSYYKNTVSPAVYDWTGPYLGAQIGYGWGEAGTGDLDGWVGGVLGGYNVQSGQFVLGVEADYGLSNIEGNSGATSVSIDGLGSVRARAGIAFEQFFLYGTGGFSFANITAQNGGSDSSFATGWVIGVGAEAALSQNWTARIEAFYYDLGSDTYAVSGTPNIGTDVTVLRAGVSYRF